MAEHGHTDPVIGVAFDGLGYGTDGNLWGGEFLVADLRGFERVGHLAPVTMPGGTAAIREPWRMAVAWAAAAGVEAALRRRPSRRGGGSRGSEPRTGHHEHGTAVRRHRRAPRARTAVTYEAQAAIALEAAARTVARTEAPSYPVDVRGEAGQLVLDPAPLIAAAVADRAGRHTGRRRGRRRPRGDRTRRGGPGRPARPPARDRNRGAEWRGVPERPAERDRRGGPRRGRPGGARARAGAGQRRRHQHRSGRGRGRPRLLTHLEPRSSG